MLKAFYRINEAAGVAMTLLPGSGPEISACLITSDGKKLDFVKKLTGVQDLRALGSQLPAKTLVALNLSGKGVLLKQIEGVTAVDNSNFNQVLPAAAYEDFYVQQMPAVSGLLVAVIRKTEADPYIRQLADAGLVVVSLSLGAHAVRSILPQLNIYGHEIAFDQHLIVRNEAQEWLSYHYHTEHRAPFPIKAESEPLAETLVLAYAAAFQLLLSDQLEPLAVQADTLRGTLQKVKADRKFKTEGVAILLVFLLLLLVNFGLLSWLNAANSRLLSQVGASDQSLQDRNKRNEAITRQELLLRQMGWNGGLNKSLLIDQVAALLPDGVILEQVSLNPYDEKASETQKRQVFADREMLISGNSAQVIPVNEWIARIKTKLWVKDVQLLSYLVDHEKNTGEFKIKITY